MNVGMVPVESRRFVAGEVDIVIEGFSSVDEGFDDLVLVADRRDVGAVKWTLTEVAVMTIELQVRGAAAEMSICGWGDGCDMAMPFMEAIPDMGSAGGRSFLRLITSSSPGWMWRVGDWVPSGVIKQKSVLPLASTRVV